MKKKLIYTITIALILLISLYASINLIIGNDKLVNFKKILNHDQKNIIKKYLFPYKYISQQKVRISQLEVKISELKESIKSVSNDLELNYKENLLDIPISRIQKIKLKNNSILAKYKLEGFYYGINKIYPGSGYLDFHNDNLIVVSARGILGYQLKNNDKIIFKQIKNNIENFIGIDQFKKYKWFSIKDLHIHNNKIFISYTEEIEENCWNTSVLFAEMNYQNINFKKLFSSDMCIHSKNNIDKEFNAHQSGGRIVSLDENQILLSIGDYRSRSLAQDKNSINGKIIKINIDNGKHEIISMGHRNIQGLVHDKENNFILATEHGPQGGDEINLINLNQQNIPNYGWAIASYGEHYGGKKIEENKSKYDRYPLLKSHSDNGFIEPLKYFVPSIGISGIVKTDTKSYVFSSLTDESIYFFNLDDRNKIVNFSRIEVLERVRDMIYKNKKLYLFLENTASIGIIEF